MEKKKVSYSMIFMIFVAISCLIGGLASISVAVTEVNNYWAIPLTHQTGNSWSVSNTLYLTQCYLGIALILVAILFTLFAVIIAIKRK